MLSNVSTTKYRITHNEREEIELQVWNADLGKWHEFLFYKSLDEIRELSVHLRDLLDTIDRGNLQDS
jgi:hypothetical protein